MRAPAAIVGVVVLLCLLASAAAKPGPVTTRRIKRGLVKPSPSELAPLPAGTVVVPLPERSSVDAVPISAWLPGLQEPSQGLPQVTPGPQDAGVTPVEPQPSSGFDPQATPTGCGAYTETNVRPLRQQWDSGNGYCGEMSLQMTAMTRGIWISQQTSRDMGVVKPCPAGNALVAPHTSQHPDLLFEDRNPISPGGKIIGIYGVAKMLGLYQPPESYWYGENQTLSNTLNPLESAFALWVKQNTIAGRPVIVGWRLQGGTYQDYDHIMPVYGLCYTRTTALDSTDTFVFTDDYLSEVQHKPSDFYFYAAYQQCGYFGCIPKDWWDMGLAVGPLNVPPGLYYPVKLSVTKWSDGTRVTGEPGQGRTTTATAYYTLTVSGLTIGATYRLYRTTGLFANYQIPISAAALATTCTSQGTSCSSIPFTATATTMTFTDTSKGTGAVAVGRFPARSVTYFLVVRA